MLRIPVRDPRYKWVILGMATLAVFGALGLARFSYTAILPSMQKGLGFDNTHAGALATVNLVGYLLLALVGGALASRFGSRVVIAIGLVAAGVGMLLTGFAGSFVSAAAGRGITGLGTAASNVPATAMVALWFAPRRRGLATGVVVGGASLGLVMVGLVVPRILAAYGADGWRVCWYLFGAGAIFLGLICYLALRSRPYAPALVTGPTKRPSLPWKKLYLSPSVWHLGVVFFAFGFAYLSYMTFFNKRLIADLGYTQQAAGNLFMILGWSSLPCGVIWGHVSDVIGRRRALSIVLVLQAGAYALFALWPATTGLTLSAVLFGITAWSVPTIMAAACGDKFGSALAPAAFGFLTVFHGLGQAVGPSVAGSMADHFGTFTPSYLLAAGVAFIGGMIALTLRPIVVCCTDMEAEPQPEAEPEPSRALPSG